MTGRRTGALRLAALGLLLLAILGASASPAEAHAVLEASVPARGAVLKASPGEVRFTFDEPIEASLGAVRVFDSSGRAVEKGEIDPEDGGRTAGVRLPDRLEPGVYTAIYQVISADSHRVSGGITFSIDPDGRGEVEAGGKSVSELLASTESGQVTKIGFWLDRLIGFAAIALALGATAWLFAVWRPSDRSAGEGSRSPDRRFRLLLGGALMAGIIATLAAIPFQGAIATGGSFWSALGGGVPGEVIGTRYGTVMLIRAAAFAAMLPLCSARAVARLRSGPAMVLAGVAGIALALSAGLAGHAATRSPVWLLLPSDFLHVTAMALWAGGLAATLWLLPKVTGVVPAEERTGILHAALERFSSVALISVAVIGVTGTIQAIAEVGSFPALVETAFGRAVSIKILLFALLLGFGWHNRQRVIPALAGRLSAREAPGAPGVAARRNLRAEVALVTVVLAVTAALVSYPPPDTLGMGPASGSLISENDQVEYTIDPARSGSNEAHVYIFDGETGAPVDVKSLNLAFDPPTEGETPIEATVRKAGPGHYVAPTVPLAIRGRWTAKVEIRFSRFDERVETFQVEIR